MARIAKLTMGIMMLLMAVATEAQRISERMSPGFSHHDANAKIGLRVELLNPEKAHCVKCTETTLRCVVVKPGERGTIVETYRAGKGYFLVVRWDQAAEDGTRMYSYFGRYSFRITIKPVI